MNERPNILYIFTDQQFSDAMSCAGNPYVSTPAMDRLASSGISFSSAYCSYPLCVPSRMSMVTGKMPHELGIFANCFPSKDPLNIPTLGTLFRDHGYNTQWVGKWHLTIPEHAIEQHGFEKIALGGDYGGTDRDKAKNAVSLLTGEGDEPFLMVVSFNNPHDCCELSRGDALKMRPLPPPPPIEDLPPLPENYEIPPNEPDYLRVFASQYDQIFQAMHWDEIKARRYLWGYYRLVEMVDEEIGIVLDALRQAGLDKNTVIVFSSDHGDGACRHRWNQKFSLYDESAKVPLVISDGRNERAGVVEATPVSAGLDLIPTLCDYADIPVPRSMHGLSLRRFTGDPTLDFGREYVVAETSFSMWAEIGQDEWPKARMVRSKNYKYTAYSEGDCREQLTDMQNDPGEMVNLAAQPRYETELVRHREYLKDWCLRTGDVFCS